MTKIKAPYNFVPLSDKVVYPSWSKAVNHDVPFFDGESGIINIKIKTHSPIFVRDGGKGSENKADEFFKSNGEYYIPGSSLKGMLRSVVQVMSFSKMQSANDDKYSVRDFQNKDIYPMLDLAKEVNAAWLWKDNDTYYMQDCGAPGRIPHHWIDEAFGTKFRQFYKTGGGFKGNSEEHKSAKFKYEKFGNQERTTGFVSATYGKDNSVDVRRFFKVDSYSKQMGTIVFTGQSGPRKEVPKGGSGKPSGKIHEFIFFETDNKPFEVKDETIKNFFFAYFDHDKNRQSIDFKYWKAKLKDGEKIPVFFRYEDENKHIIKDMGLSLLYKIIYEKSVLDSVPQNHKKDEKDFTETLFGHIDNKQSLKGRVHIGHAKAINDAKVLGVEKSVLSGPKASYYPNYIRQSGKNGVTNKYKTFMDDTAIIAGWKRYPVHKDGVLSNPGSTDNSKVETSFIPLDKGVEFEFKIRVHNVRKAELGAILSAITFHNTKGTFHSIGMAKPLGYGKSELVITSLEGFNDSIGEYLKQFEAYMNYALNSKTPTWHSSQQITELLTMVSEHDNLGKSELSYMKMDTKGTNDFTEAKKKKEFLDAYSNLVGKRVIAKPLVSESDIANCAIIEKQLEANFLSADLERAKQEIIIQTNKKITEGIKEKQKQLLDVLEKASSDIDEYIIAINNKIKGAFVSDGLQKFCEIKNKLKFKRFKDLQNIVNQYLKTANRLSEDDKTFIQTIITNIYQSSAKFEKKQFTVKYKRVISNWLGEQTAQQWYNELTKK